ncbi:hypothetical protein GJ496_005645 [Pomphorhynchus laevis]|nr:hypothetical protein GJ496_005645 [Pomphorhynchus laevis]
MCKLFVHDCVEQQAKEQFSRSNIQITTKGTEIVGSAIGNRSYLDSFINTKISNWLGLLRYLEIVAGENPHNCKSNFDSYDRLFLVNSTIPLITGVALDSNHVNMMFLPLRLRGLSIQSPNRTADAEYERSLRMARPLLDGLTGNELTLKQCGIASEIN